MEDYSSDSSSSKMAMEFDFADEPWIFQDYLQLESGGFAEGQGQEIVDLSAGVVTDPQYQFNQTKQRKKPKSGGGGGGGGSRPKLTPAQKKENKRQSDYRYRQKRKMTADEQTAEIKHLKEENDVLKAKNRMLKEKFGLMPFNQVAAERLHSTYIPQSTSKLQLDQHQTTVSCDLQEPHVTNYYGDAYKLSNLETNESSQNLQETIPIYAVATEDYITENQKNSQTGTRSCYDDDDDDDTPITDLLMKIDADDGSKVKFSDFTGLDGERITVGKYSFPLSLQSIAERIIDVWGDITATSKMNPSIAETTHIMLCASVKEMWELQLEQVTEDRILKWRDTIKDALRINFKVEFAMEHLKKIASAYIGLKERQKLENVAIKISKLEADLNAGKEEHAKICERSKVYMGAVDEFNGKNLGMTMFQSLPTAQV